MEQSSPGPQGAGAAGKILAGAVDEYCAAFAVITDEIDHGRAATPQQLERAMAAILQLENAQTLFELDANARRDAHEATPPRLLH